MTKKVVFLCAAGMSTSLLVNKARAAAKQLGKDQELEFAADPVSKAGELVPSADIILVAPQVRYELKNLQKKYPDKIFVLIEPRTYGMCDGPAIIALAEAHLTK
jgi:Phosphotransferase system cellobiose-specific component IIB